MGVGASGYAVVCEPLLVQTAQNSQALELRVTIEDVVDDTLKSNKCYTFLYTYLV